MREPFRNRLLGRARPAADVTTPVPGHVVEPPPERFRLRFSGSADAARFQETVERQVFWYHSYFFENGFEVRGDYDIGRNVHEYGFPEDMTGMKVLDIGSGSGWFSFFFEQRGAEVTAVDVPSFSQIDSFGQYSLPPLGEPDAHGPTGRPIHLNDVSRGLWTMRELLDSNVKMTSARVYDVEPTLFDGETFDLVFMGALLMHLRDPIGALMAARSVCRGRMIATNWILPDEPEELPRADLPFLGPDEFLSWWRPNRQAYELWFKAAGFARVDVSRDVTLTADLTRAKHYSDAPSNPTQILGLADAHVE